MKASELIEKLQAEIAERGDRDVEFYCDHTLPAWYNNRPVERVGWCVSVRGESIILDNSAEWRARVMARAQTEREHIEAEIEAHKPRGFWAKFLS